LACAYRFWTERSLNGILVARGDQPILPAPAFKKICAHSRSKRFARSCVQKNPPCQFDNMRSLFAKTRAVERLDVTSRWHHLVNMTRVISSAKEWLDSASRNIGRIEGAVGISPVQAIFHSWNSFTPLNHGRDRLATISSTTVWRSTHADCALI